MTDYRVPRLADLPAELRVVLVNRTDLPPVGGGETPIIAVAPAIANAIFRACGVRLRSMPLVPGGRVPLGSASDRLARVQDSERIERTLDGACTAIDSAPSSSAEPVPLERADAVLAGQRPAEFQRRPEDLLRRRPTPRRASPAGAVEDEHRVQVAVPGVGHGGEHTPCWAATGLDRVEHLRELGSSARRRPRSGTSPAARSR